MTETQESDGIEYEYVLYDRTNGIRLGELSVEPYEVRFTAAGEAREELVEELLALHDATTHTIIETEERVNPHGIEPLTDDAEALEYRLDMICKRHTVGYIEPGSEHAPSRAATPVAWQEFRILDAGYFATLFANVFEVDAKSVADPPESRQDDDLRREVPAPQGPYEWVAWNPPHARSGTPERKSEH